MNPNANAPWPTRLVPAILWKSFFWIVRNSAAAARVGWDAAGVNISTVAPSALRKP